MCVITQNKINSTCVTAYMIVESVMYVLISSLIKASYDWTPDGINMWQKQPALFIPVLLISFQSWQFNSDTVSKVILDIGSISSLHLLDFVSQVDFSSSFICFNEKNRLRHLDWKEDAMKPQGSDNPFRSLPADLLYIICSALIDS